MIFCLSGVRKYYTLLYYVAPLALRDFKMDQKKTDVLEAEVCCT
jgi:hypothetical protein